MAVHFLTRHREPKPTESLYGYVLRLTDENGYERPARVLARAGIPHGKVVGRDLDVRKLAKITGHSEELAKIAYNAKKYGDAFLLGHRVNRTDIRRGATAVCPDCIAERGFLQAHFDLKLMVACPVHKSYLIQKCKVCKQDLVWSRPSLIQCSCGAALPSNSLRRGVPYGELKLLRLLREKVLGKEEHTGPALERYEREFLSYDLQFLLFAIRQLGKRWSRVHGGESETMDSAEIISNAAIAISDWPRNFNELIRLVFERRTKEAPPRTETMKFSSMYRTMFVSEATGWRNLREQGPIWKAYVEFAVENWGRDAVDARLFRECLGSDGPFLTAAEVSRRTGITRKTIIRMANDGELDAFAPSVGSMRPLVAVTALSQLAPKNDGNVLNLREAARILGVSVSVLKILKTRGVYQARHYTRGSEGFHEEDLEDLRQQIAASSPRIGASPAGCTVSFGRLMKHTVIAPKAKADIIEAILAGEIPLLGATGTSPDRRQVPVNSISDGATRRLASMLA